MENLYLVRDGAGWKAGVLDTDFMCKFGQHAGFAGEAQMLKSMQGAPRFSWDIRTMQNCRMGPGAYEAMENGANFFPNANYVWRKVLEKNGAYVRFNEAGVPTGTGLDINLIREAYPNLLDDLAVNICPH